jgi:AraC-like DNA-binding protein
MTVVQPPYDPVQAGIAIGSAHHVSVEIRPAEVGQWQQRFNPHWTMVWGGGVAYDNRLDLPGRGVVEVRRQPRDWAVFAPDTNFHERMLRPERARECIWLFFTPRIAMPQLERRRYTLVLDRDDAIARAARAMARAQQAGTATGELIARGHLQVILGLVLSSASEAPGDDRGAWQVPPDGPAPTGLLAQVDRLMDARLADPPSRAEVAAALGISESSFSHRFRAETGLTLSERVRWLRVRAAKARLGDADASVKRVAGELGFSSPFYFSRVFSEVTGMTPSAYRLALRGGEVAE